MIIGCCKADICAINATYFNVDTDVMKDVVFDYDREEGSHRVLRHFATYLRHLERRLDTTHCAKYASSMNRARERICLCSIATARFSIFDFRSSAPTVSDVGRPGLHAFLASV